MADKLEFRYYLLALIDILGQRERLRQLRALPNTSSETERMHEILRETVGQVKQLRDTFDDFFNGYNAPSTQFDNFATDQKEWAECVRKCVASRRGVSDSVIISVPILKDNEQCNSLGSIHGALVSICGAITVALATKCAIRGGVDVGLGLPITGDETYGPVVERAVYLEAQVARWPRVVAGEELWTYLSASEATQSPTPAGKLAQQLAALAKSLMIRTHEGELMLDFLGQSVKRYAESLGKDKVEDAYNFVCEQHEKFHYEQNEKLERRYLALRIYMESRLPLWGISKKT